MLKAIHAQEDRAAAEAKARDVVAKLRAARLRKAAELVEAGVAETLAYYAFPEPHWRRIRTNNPLERIIREIRRRTRVVGAFPDGESALNLAAARLRHIAGTHWSTRRYLDMQPLHQAELKTACKRRTYPGSSALSVQEVADRGSGSHMGADLSGALIVDLVRSPAAADPGGPLGRAGPSGP